MDERYSRQVLFKPIGEIGQQRLIDKHVLVIGAGALGSSIAENLVRAGVGKLTIVDRDYVEYSNLQRQQLYKEKDADEHLPKVIAAKQRLNEINSSVEVISHVMDVSVEELEGLVGGIDLIMDATDNFDTRLIINDISQKYKIPWIYGACVGSYGLSYTILPQITPCLHCLLESVPMGGATCDTVGIISPAVQMVVAHQTAEALKILVEDFEALEHKLISFDVWKNQHTKIRVQKMKKESCPSCGNSPSYPFLSYENQTKTAVLCGRNTIQIRPPKKMERNFDELEKILQTQEGKIERNPFLISFTKAEKRMVFFKDGRVFIHGTKDISEAKTLYHRILG